MPGTSEALRLFISNVGSRSCLDVGGELDLGSVDDLGDHLDLLVTSGTGDVAVDMAAVTFCDATACASWSRPITRCTPPADSSRSSTRLNA